jgi:hypothetical protein
MKAMRSQPHRGMTLVASHYNGWYKGTVESVPLGTRQHPTHIAYLRHATYHNPVTSH